MFENDPHYYTCRGSLQDNEFSPTQEQGHPMTCFVPFHLAQNVLKITFNKYVKLSITERIDLLTDDMILYGEIWKYFKKPCKTNKLTQMKYFLNCSKNKWIVEYKINTQKLVTRLKENKEDNSIYNSIKDNK